MSQQMEEEQVPFGPYAVSEISHDFIRLRDGTQLGIRLWMPKMCGYKLDASSFISKKGFNNPIDRANSNSATAGPDDRFPVILEYLPYYKELMTASRDRNRHPWFSSHGFVCARVDIRGTGSSTGYTYDEYTPQEQEDCAEVIEWLTKQDWCNGNVGMYGKSWGGFNGLQMSFEQTPGLKTCISLYSTDNRYTDDIHYQGNAVVGNGMLSWSAYMFAWNARPPPMEYFEDKEEWRKAWRSRLEEGGRSQTHIWLEHQHQADPYWRHGSVDQNIKRIECPVLIIGGHTDGYTTAAIRMAATLNDDSRALIGPWCHEWPDTSAVGPNIHFLNLCLAWFRKHLHPPTPKGYYVDTTVADPSTWPRLTLFIRDSLPSLISRDQPGSFVDVHDWQDRYLRWTRLLDGKHHFADSTHNSLEGVHRMMINRDGELQPLIDAECNVPDVDNCPDVHIPPHAMQGAEAGVWCPFGGELDFAGDQHVANKYGKSWYTKLLGEDVVIAGLSCLVITLGATTNVRKTCVNVLISDVCGTTGQSTLVTRGCQNLGQPQGSGATWIGKLPSECESFSLLNEEGCMEVRVNLGAVGHRIKAGNRLCITVSPTYFPMMWPAQDSSSLSIKPERSILLYQTLDSDEMKMNLRIFDKPSPLLQYPCKQVSPSHFSSKSSMAKSNTGTEYKMTVTEDSGMLLHTESGFECQESSTDTYTTDEAVTYGEVDIMKTIKINLPTHDTKYKMNTRIETWQQMKGDSKKFDVTERLKVYVRDSLYSNEEEVFFEKEWKDVITRKFI